MKKMTLFDFAVAGMKAQAEVNKLCNQPLAHTNDPITSYEAAEKMVESGNLTRQQESVLRIIQRYSRNHRDFTPLELTDGHRTALYFAIQRRKNELKNKGKIEETGEIREGLEVWRLV